MGYLDNAGLAYLWGKIKAKLVQSDWNQNGTIAADYVKNRPFYRMPGIVSFLDEATYYFTNDFDFYQYQFDLKKDLVVGQTYTINWDGVEYECVCKQIGSSSKYIGNPSIVESSYENTGEPFLIIGTGVITQNTSASHVISVTTQGYIYEKLPAEYIEDDAVSRVLLYNKPTITKNQILAYQDDILGGKIAAVSWGGEFFYNLSPGNINNTYVLTANSLDGLTLRFEGSLNDSGEITYDLTSTTFYDWTSGNGRVDAPTFLVDSYTQRAIVRPYSNYVGIGTDTVIFEVKSNGSKGKGFQALGTGAICTPLVILHSITSDSTKKFKVTVDDSGVIMTTDVDDGSEVKMATEDDLAAKADKSTDTTATLLASGWTGDSAPYSYTLAVAGVTADSNQELLPALDITTEQLSALQAANIQDGGQAAGSITLKAFGEDKPTIDLPIRIILRGD